MWKIPGTIPAPWAHPALGTEDAPTVSALLMRSHRLESSPPCRDPRPPRAKSTRHRSSALATHQSRPRRAGMRIVIGASSPEAPGRVSSEGGRFTLMSSRPASAEPRWGSARSAGGCWCAAVASRRSSWRHALMPPLRSPALDRIAVPVGEHGGAVSASIGSASASASAFAGRLGPRSVRAARANSCSSGLTGWVLLRSRAGPHRRR